VSFFALLIAAACSKDPPAPPQMPPAPAPGSLADPSQPSAATTAPAPAAATTAAATTPSAPAVPAVPAAAVVHEPEPAKAVEHEEHEKLAAAKPSENAKTEPEAHATKEKESASAKEPRAADKPEPPAPEPAEEAPKVIVPHTAHIHADVPKGLQHWLNADTRMQPWLNKVMPVIDGCYTQARKRMPKAAGTATLRITMHENARPDIDIESVPPELGGMVACATAKLIRTRSPLFAGKEGDAYTVHVHFEK
jgi:hypothetical protein